MAAGGENRSEGVSFAVQTANHNMTKNRFNTGLDRATTCTGCERTGYTIEQCFRAIGYPQ